MSEEAPGETVRGSCCIAVGGGKGYWWCFHGVPEVLPGEGDSRVTCFLVVSRVAVSRHFSKEVPCLGKGQKERFETESCRNRNQGMFQGKLMYMLLLRRVSIAK